MNSVDFVFSPSADIHLFMHDADGNPCSAGGMVSYNGYALDENWLKTPTAVALVFEKYEDRANPVSNPIAINLQDKTIRALRVGEACILVKQDIGGSINGLLVRVRVHDRLAGFWLANESVSTHTDLGNDSYTLTVLAKFIENNDPFNTTVADISRHSYLRYQSSQPAKVTVNSAGLLHVVAGSLPEANAAEITVSIPGFMPPAPGGVSTMYNNNNVLINIVDSLAQPRPLLKRLHIGTASVKRNFLLLGEGFIDYATFEEYCKKLIDEISFTNNHSPLNLLMPSMDIWVANAMSYDSESGVSLGFPLTELSNPLGILSNAPANYTPPPGTPAYSPASLLREFGYPSLIPPTNTSDANTMLGMDTARLSPDALDAWLQQREVTIPQVKDTALGVVRGQRQEAIKSRFILTSKYGDITATYTHRMRQIDMLNDWHKQPEPPRVPTFDSRRDALNKNYDSFLRSLVNRPDQIPISGTIWAENGLEQGQATVVLYAETRGASTPRNLAVNQRPTAVGLLISIGNNSLYRIQPVLDNVAVKVRKNVPNITYSNLVIAELASLFAHELGHVLKLGDEYPAYAGGNTTELPSAAQQNLIKTNFNLEVIDHLLPLLQQSPLPVEFKFRDLSAVEGIAWNLHRIQVSSGISGPLQLDGSNIKIPIDEGQIIKWKKLSVVQSSNVYLRTKLSSSTSLHLLGPFTLDATFPHGDQILVINTANTVVDISLFTSGDLVYIPLLNATKIPRRLIHEIVAEYMTTTRYALSPHYASYSHNEVTSVNEAPLAIRDQFETRYMGRFILGLYEGADEWNNGVYRPTVNSKMYNDFIYGYALANSPNNELSQDKAMYFYTPFNFVSQYFIIDTLNPSMHDVLDTRYEQETRTYHLNKPKLNKPKKK